MVPKRRKKYDNVIVQARAGSRVLARREMGTKTIGQCSRDVLARLGIRPEEAAALQSLWVKHVQGPLAEHVRPVRYAQGVLSLQADSPVWASRLRQFEPELIGRLRREEYLRELRALKLRVDPSRAAIGLVRAPSRRAVPVPPTLEAAAAIRSTAEAIGDPLLRASLLRLAAHTGGLTTGVSQQVKGRK